MCELRHDDCRNFIPVDVAKGICQLTGELVMIDTPVCPECSAIPKCKFCSNYAAGETPFLGECKASKKGFWAYEDLKAFQCKDFAAKKDLAAIK